MIAITKLFALAPVALVFVVATTVSSASVDQPSLDTEVKQTENVRVQRDLTPKKQTQCIYAEVSKNGKKSLICGDPAPSMLTTLMAKSSNSVASPSAPILSQSSQPLVTEQVNKQTQQARTFLDCLKKPDPVNVYVQPQQQFVPQQHYVQPQIHVEQPQVHYVQPQIHFEQPQVHYVQQPQVQYVQQPQVQYVQQPQVHYVQQPSTQVVYQKPLCQQTDQFSTGYGGGGYYGKSVEYLDYPEPTMKSDETGELVQNNEDVLQQTAYTPAALYSDPATQYGGGPTVAVTPYDNGMNRKGSGGFRTVDFSMMRPTPLFRPVFKSAGGDPQYLDNPFPLPYVPVMMERMSDNQLGPSNQQYGQYGYIIHPVSAQQKLYNDMLRTAEVQGQQMQPALDYPETVSAISDQVPASAQDELKNAQESSENQRPENDAQSTNSSDQQKDNKSQADQNKTSGNKNIRN